jgi:hypothetical protein
VRRLPPLPAAAGSGVSLPLHLPPHRVRILCRALEETSEELEACLRRQCVTRLSRSGSRVLPQGLHSSGSTDEAAGLHAGGGRAGRKRARSSAAGPSGEDAGTDSEEARAAAMALLFARV